MGKIMKEGVQYGVGGDRSRINSTVTFSSDVTPGSTNAIYRKGNIVSIVCRFTTPSEAISGLTIGTFPTWCKPISTMYTLGVRAWAQDENAPISIGTDGALRFINRAYATGVDYIISATWLTEADYPS